MTVVEHGPDTPSLHKRGRIKGAQKCDAEVVRTFPADHPAKAYFECEVAWMKEVGNHSIVVGNVAAVSIDEDSVTETYELKIDTLHRVHYLGKFCKTIFVGVGKMHDVETL